MQEDFRLIVDLVTVLTAAAIGGLVAALFRQPVLLGYLLGGIVVGPAGLGLIKELVQVETLAQLGVAFLLFALGVEFSLGELQKVRRIALGGGTLQIVLTIAITALVSLWIGWVTSAAQGVFLGAILSLSSTAVVLKSLMERHETETSHGQVMLGILIVQDLALGLMLAVLPALDQPIDQIGTALGWAVVRTGLFAAGAIAVGIWIVPPLLRFLARTESRELFLLGVVALCLSIALLTEYLGLSVEMGAFVAGLMISEVEYADQTLAYVEPIRDVCASLFFAAIGMLIDPLFLWNNLELILGLVALVLVGKFIIIAPLVTLFRYSWKTAIISGLGLAQIGEFSFVLASKGQALGLVSRRVYLLILGTTAVTLVVTPFVLRLIPQLLLWAESVPWLRHYLDSSSLPLETATELPARNHVVVCGYGRVGQTIVQLLQSHNYPVVVIDQSEQAIQKLRQAKIPYVYGNAASLPVLEKAGVDTAQGMAIVLPDSMSTRLCLKRSLELAPKLDVVVRASQNRDIELLYQLGAREVVQPEFEASLELSTHLLSGMGVPMADLQAEVQAIRSSHYLALRPDRPATEVSREVRIATQDMPNYWFNLPVESPLTGMTLAESNMRELTGVSLVAIQRTNGDELDYPTGSTVLEEGDRLLVVGEPSEFSAFAELASGRVAIPTNSASCQWITIAANSPVIGKPISALNWTDSQENGDGVKIQALRREGRFIQLPEGTVELQAGDRLLLCGSQTGLLNAQRQLSPLEAHPSTVDNNQPSVAHSLSSNSE
ncbi:MAG: cation:proton antiporter [Cyanobacteria bacterium]|nr:cation:proton antiporter [Cyanobacteriota bacterium]MDW8199987.1 cation:proton antiporter [Cyanobacteriota bacterium SKYGB_h_bin112]